MAALFDLGESDTYPSSMCKIRLLKLGCFRLGSIFKAVLLTVLAAGIGGQAFSEKLSLDLDDLRFDWFEESEGFASIAVVAIHQDRLGFVWVGTRDGLYRFDGERFREYRHGSEARLSLPRSWVEFFHEDSKGNLWVALQGAVVRYDYRSEQFVEHKVAGYLGNAVLFSESEDGRFLMMNQSGSLFELDEFGVFQTVETKEKDWARCSTISDDGTLFVGGRSGVVHYRSDLQELRFYDASSILSDNSNSFVTAMAKVDENDLWVGTNRNGVWRLSLDSGVFTKVNSESLDADRVGAILPDERGSVLVGTTAGLSVYSENGDSLKMYQWNRYNPNSIPTGTVYSMESDRQGNLWFGTSRGGLSVVRNSKQFFGIDDTGDGSSSLSKQKVTSILEDSRNRLWVGYHNESVDLFDFDAGTKTFFDAHSVARGAIGRGSVWDIVETDDGCIWIGTNRGGLSCLKPGEQEFRQFLPSEGDPSSIGGVDVRVIVPDESGNLWLVLHGAGVDYFDRESMAFVSLGGSRHQWAEDLIIGRNGDVWVGSSRGVGVLRKGGDAFEDFSSAFSGDFALPDAHVFCLTEDKKGRLWVGTGGGLSVLRSDGKGFDSYGLKDGLPSLAIRSVVEAPGGDIWVSTGGGLARLNEETGLFHSYYKEDGLLSNQFVERSVHVDQAGNVLLGSERGIVRFKPVDIRTNKIPPELLITGFNLFSEPVYPSEGDNAILKESTLTSKEIVLPPGKTTFGFEFAAPDFVSGGRVHYEYMLEGFDTRWISNGYRSDCSYTNIAPGEYVFRVRASNSDGVLNEEGVSLAVVVLPFFWQTNWFVAVVAFVLLFSFVLVLRLRTASLARQKIVLLDTVSERTKDLQDALYEMELQKAQIEDQNLELLDHRENLEELIEQRTTELVFAKEKAEESDRLKSSFLENISHEIRTPMNAILGFVNILKEDYTDSKERDEYLGIIEENGESLMELIDDIIEISILESSKAEMKSECTEVHSYFSNWQDYLRSELDNSGKSSIASHLEFEGSESSSLTLEFDPIRFDQILRNLLGNAVKFTDAGAITIRYGSQEGYLNCEVADTGIGIPKEYLSDVFSLFRKLSDGETRLYRGTGLGLAIVKQVVDLMEGEIKVESVQGKGTRFSLRVPLLKSKTVE